MPEEEIHGGLKSGVHTDEGDDAWVPCHSQSIDDQEDKEEWDLEVWTFQDSCENKLSDLGEISISHVTVWKLIYLGKKRKCGYKLPSNYFLGLPLDDKSNS